jgi:hypothetical protein
MAKRGDSKTEAPPTQPVPTAPKAEEMKEAWARFEAGDNRAARAAARGVLASASASEAAKAEAREMLGRVGYDPGAALSVLVITLVIAGIVVALLLGHKFD